jgi:hypothetical protein
MWSRAAGISDQGLVDFTIEQDLVEVCPIRQDDKWAADLTDKNTLGQRCFNLLWNGYPWEDSSSSCG